METLLTTHLSMLEMCIRDRDFTEGILDEEEYVFAKKAYDEQYVDLSRRLAEAVQRKVKFAEAMSEDNKWLTLMKSVSGATMLSQAMCKLKKYPN